MRVIEKWRELKTDPKKIEYKDIRLLEILSYPHCGNDVIEGRCSYNDNEMNLFIKIERSPKSSFQTEVETLKKLREKKYYLNIPKVIEDGYIDDKKYIVLTKIEKERLSTIFLSDITSKEKESFLYKYGRELAKIHTISIDDFDYAPKRTLNDIPRAEKYEDVEDEVILNAISYLKENNPDFNQSTFIHGDFHYANIYWKDKEISGVLDWEYSGKGFKEHDIAIALILRNTQTFMDNISDIKSFLSGYKSLGNYEVNNLKWCLINGYVHFYLMHKNDDVYLNKIKDLLNELRTNDFL